MNIPNNFGGRYLYPPEREPYNSLKLLEEMIRDSSILKCRNAVLQNRHLFQDKVVLDVNCGTGLLCMLVASQGAKTVIGIEPSYMAELADKTIKKNAIKNVEIIRKKVNDITALPLNIEKVDIIVSQWQAYLIFDRNLLAELLQARDRWLKTSGLMFPDTITLRIEAVECPPRRRDLFKHQSELFNFGALSKIYYHVPKFEHINQQQVVTNSAVVRKMNLKKMCLHDFSFSENFVLTSLQSRYIHAFLLFFEVDFTKGHKTQRISSSPEELQSRWKPILLCFENHLFVHPNEQIKGTFKMKLDEKAQALIFNVAIDFWGTFCRTQFAKEYIW